MEQCKEEIAYVKDQIQEVKKSSGINARYVKKSSQLENAIHLKECNMEVDYPGTILMLLHTAK